MQERKPWPDNLLEILGEDGLLGTVTLEELNAALPRISVKFEKIDKAFLGFYRDNKTPRELAEELNVPVRKIHQFRIHGLAVVRERIKANRVELENRLESLGGNNDDKIES